MTGMRKLLAFSVFTLALLGCPPSGPVPAEGLDGSLTAASPCMSAQANLLRLQCKDSEGRLLGGPNKANQQFSAVCQNAVANRDATN